MIKNLAQLKRTLVKGAEFEITNHCRPEVIGERRRVNYADTTGIYTIVPDSPESKASLANGERGSYLEWGRASRWKFDGETCSRYGDDAHTDLIIEFKIKG